MSWFDKGLKVLLEAQKQIDKALDIQENVSTTTEDTSGKRAVAKRTPGGANREKKCKTDPNTPTVEENTTSTWGSFTGSFFDNPKTSNEMITEAPKMGVESNPLSTTLITNVTKRQSVTSNSDSVELLTPSSPCSELLSNTDTAINTSESIELITASPSGDITSPDSNRDSLNDSIVIIASHDAADEEDDSMSYDTVMETTLTPCPDSSTGIEILDTKNLPTSSGLCNLSTNTLKSFTEETQTIDSDSTQSFEDIQLQTSILKNANKDILSDSTDDNRDLNKLAFPTSCSNSNDEMETTTSSDIEIISNPNGDSSSTNSTTPLKLKKFEKNSMTSHSTANKPRKGHCREPSEISILSEDSQSEVDKLSQRISELNEVLELRELRLLESERQNSALQERNNELQVTLDALKNNSNCLESSEEYTQRLSALEKKFQASIRERDTLRTQIKTLKDELHNKIPKNDLTQIVNENNTMINELRLEGEKLSKEILQQSNIIKKLRTKEKTSDNLLKKNKEQIESFTDELERLKKTLNAKEDQERIQIEAVHKMSSEKRRLDEENALLRSKNEDLQSKILTVQTNFEAVKIEMQQRAFKSEEMLVAKKELEEMKSENEELVQQLNETREKLRFYEKTLARREQQLMEENKELLNRLEAAELRAETSTQEVSLTTIPLIRQLESLQNTLTQRTSNWNKEEKSLMDKLNAAQARLKSLKNVESTFKEKQDMLQTRCLELEEKLSNALLQEERSKISLHQAQMEYSMKETQINKEIIKLKDTVTDCEDKKKLLEESNRNLEQKLETLKEIKVQHSASLDNINQRDFSTNTYTEFSRSVEQQRSQSPTTSFGANSVEEVLGVGNDGQTDDFDCISNSGVRYGTTSILGMNLNLMGNNTSTLEHLQSMLKQRDGELNHLQWELSRLQAERSVLNDEITHLTMELENLKEKLQPFEQLDKNFNDLQHRYDALLQMYGEKVERTEELELDLIELKEAYKTQIDELLAQPQSKT
ncbi:TATA element modulatory factor [Teleopsis dalmanni]|uniref:TATA element modulatory factor n=1 Tax=Teleopsis dalmanni TaxID=139649 RepID=UPI0018CEBF6F|nr:TATA element modulatory factor [Teleopsis dalmanni]